jgi:hypothetical protein
MHSDLALAIALVPTAQDALVILHQFLVGVVDMAHLEPIMDLADMLNFVGELVKL